MGQWYCGEAWCTVVRQWLGTVVGQWYCGVAWCTVVRKSWGTVVRHGVLW